MTSSSKEFEGRRSFGFKGEPLDGGLRIPCYQRTEPTWTLDQVPIRKMELK
jgi:hypothetical protein